jgi:hypothetical protein
MAYHQNKQNKKWAAKGQRQMILYKDPELKPFRRICTFAGGVISSSAGNLIALNTCSNDTVRTIGSPEFTSLSPRYQEFRVRRIINRYVPVWPNCQVFGCSATANHSLVYAGTFWGGSSPANGQGLLSSTGGKVTSTNREIVIQADWNNFENGKLWTPVGSAVATANNYGVAICGPVVGSSTIVASTDYYTVFNEWDVEFQGEA